jgi:uncharacterized protein YqgV (UPF0045/DUF77 family)
MAYTTVANISQELGGVPINGSTTPTTTVVEGWIEEATDEINRITGQVFEATAITSAKYEYIDYRSNGRIILNHAPVQSIQSIEFLSEPLGSTVAPTWIQLVEGRGNTDNFILYEDEGLLVIHNHQVGSHALTYGKRNVRVRYTHGPTTTPPSIARLATLMVAKRYIQATANNNATNSGGIVRVGAIDISDPTNYVLSHLDRIAQEEQRLLKDVAGTFKSTLYRTNIFDD